MDESLERSLKQAAKGEGTYYDNDEDFLNSLIRYKIVRFHFNKENELIKTGLTLEEAQEHCNREDTHNLAEGWFDGYTEE